MKTDNMKQAYTSPAMQETTMALRLAIAELTYGVTGDDGTGWGGVDNGGKLDPESNSRDDWDAFWNDRE